MGRAVATVVLAVLPALCSCANPMSGLEYACTSPGEQSSCGAGWQCVAVDDVSKVVGRCIPIGETGDPGWLDPGAESLAELDELPIGDVLPDPVVEELRDQGPEGFLGDGPIEVCNPIANCLGRECGDDLCGGSCGKCAEPQCDGLTWSPGATCESGKCVAVSEVVCDDGIPCTKDTCDPKIGCGVSWDECIACSVDLPCEEDEDLCTTAHCSDPAGGFCQFERLNCDDGSACTDDRCDSASGDCVHPPKNCDDGTICTTDSCDPSTGCLHVLRCTDGDLCTDDRCDLLTGECLYPDKDCDDHDACTIDSCHPATGYCVNEQIICNDFRHCTIDSCDVVVGCFYLPTDCNDQQPSTGDWCDEISGDCKHLPAECDDEDGCTRDVYDPDSGKCSHEPKCLSPNQCLRPVCDLVTYECSFPPIDCDDSLRCTRDSCDPFSGECSFVLTRADNT